MSQCIVRVISPMILGYTEKSFDGEIQKYLVLSDSQFWKSQRVLGCC